MLPRGDLSATLVPEQVELALLLLVDNSQGLRTVWPDIQDHYLPLLLRHIESLPYPTVQTKILVVQSNPTIYDSGTIEPRYYRALRDAAADIRFAPQSNNRLTLTIIKKGLELLASTSAVERHAIILAASAPTLGRNDPSSNLDCSRWALLAQYLAKERIHCHLMINPHADTSLFTTLFEENLRLQNLIEKQTWLPVDGSKMILRMSGHADFATQEPYNSVSRRVLNSFDASLAAPRSTSGASSPSSPPEPQELVPSLVAQLQQVHGLTKKKVYGAKPVRKPFVSTEIYRENARKSLSLPPLLPPDTTNGGRVPSSALAGRSARHSQTAPVILSQSRCPDGVGSSPINRSPSSVSGYSQLMSSPTSPVRLADYHLSSLNPWLEASHQPSTWASAPSSTSDLIYPSQNCQSIPAPDENLQSTTDCNDFTRSIPPRTSFISPTTHPYSGRESPNYRPVSGPHPPTCESTSTSTSTSPSPDIHDNPSMGLYPSPHINEPFTNQTMSMTQTRHIPRSVYRDELLSHLEVPNKPLVSTTPSFASGRTRLSSSSMSPSSSMKTPPSALFSTPAGVHSSSSHVFSTPSVHMDSLHSPIPSQTPSPPQGYSRVYSVSPLIPPSNFSTSSHWGTISTSNTVSDAPNLPPTDTNDSAFLVDNVAFETGENLSVSTETSAISTRTQPHVSHAAVLTPLTIPSNYPSSGEPSSIPSSGSSSLTGWAG